MKKFKRKHYKKEFSFPSYPQPFPAPHHRQYSYYFLLYASRDVLWVYRHTYMVYSFFFFLISEVAYYTAPCCFHFLYLGSLLSHPGLVHSCWWLHSIPWCGEGIWDRKAPTRVCWIDGGFLCCPRHLRHVALSVQFSSVAHVCPVLFDPMDCNKPGFPVLHYLPELAQTHVHWVGDAIQPSHLLSSPSPPPLNLSQHQGLF